MYRVLLIHAGIIPHYRVPIYSFLSRCLKRDGFDLFVTADGIQPDSPYSPKFKYCQMRLSVARIVQIIYRQHIDIIIDYMELRHRYLFPTYLAAKVFMRKKIIYWGQGRDLLDVANWAKNLAYYIEQASSDALILYGGHLKKYVSPRFHNKIFIANNTLFLNYRGLPPGVTKEDVLTKYGISTTKNIICIGRMQKRKRIGNLVDAFLHMKRADIGLILAGPDSEAALEDFRGGNIYKLGPIYDKEKFDLLSSADIYCLPGAVGLSIVDAFHCGLPFVTESGDLSAEIMYLKDNVNGFVVPQNDIPSLSHHLQILLDDDELRKSFSEAAKQEIRSNGDMRSFYGGFRDALLYVTK